MPMRAPVDRLEDEDAALSAPEAAELDAAELSEDASDVVAESVVCEMLELEVADEPPVVYPEERLVTMVPVATLTALALQSQSVSYPRQQ
jgi:hypothetical protein